MKYIRKIPPTDRPLSDRLAAEGWKKIREPKSIALSISASFPLMIVNGIAAVMLILLFYDPFAAIPAGNGFAFQISLGPVSLLYIAGFLIFMLAHEIIHALFIPDIRRSDNVFWGITWFGGFISTTNEIGRGRFFLITAAPFVILSLLLPVVLGLSGLMSGFWAFCIVVNAMSSSVDMLNLLLILFQTPRKCRIVINGFETFYK